MQTQDIVGTATEQLDEVPQHGQPGITETGFRPLARGGSASVICFHSWLRSPVSSTPMPGRLPTVGSSRRLALSSRY